MSGKRLWGVVVFHSHANYSSESVIFVLGNPTTNKWGAESSFYPDEICSTLSGFEPTIPQMGSEPSTTVLLSLKLEISTKIPFYVLFFMYNPKATLRRNNIFLTSRWHQWDIRYVRVDIRQISDCMTSSVMVCASDHWRQAAALPRIVCSHVDT